MADELLFLTELLGLKVYDLKGRRLGFVKDAAIVPLIHPARVDRFLVGGGWSWLTVKHDQVRSISLDGIFPAREAVVMQQQARGVPNVGSDYVFIGNGVSELIDLSLRVLLDKSDEGLLPSRDYRLWSGSSVV